MTGEPPALLVAPVSHKAARHAVMNWHYSRKMPNSRLFILGVWEAGRYIGAVIYGRGANNRIGQPYGLRQTEVTELVRVALREHAHPVSQILAASFKVLREKNPGLRLVVSYADPEQGHHGGIYQAGNWAYVGKSQAQAELLVDGEFVHKRTANSRWGTASPEKIRQITGKPVTWSPVYWKHTYVMPLDRATRRAVKARQKPYPPRMG